MDVAQLVEHWIVAPVVAGSNPVIHPRRKPSDSLIKSAGKKSSPCKASSRSSAYPHRDITHGRAQWHAIPNTHPTQGTSSEISTIRELVTSDDYRHVPTYPFSLLLIFSSLIVPPLLVGNLIRPVAIASKWSGLVSVLTYFWLVTNCNAGSR